MKDKTKQISRRDLLKAGAAVSAGALATQRAIESIGTRTISTAARSLNART
ncbi:MAG: twin-arginine translocation signal domain-containing protein [Planctomycetes bacterium]|nr:twin-arginine translocation signal domain-containing protein [Planctomycetota bacterium]MBL7185563.1 twin-arginine translocation signal domain-containing protein [Phycisphaerae bacterium]